MPSKSKSKKKKSSSGKKKNSGGGGSGASSTTPPVLTADPSTSTTAPPPASPRDHPNGTSSAYDADDPRFLRAYSKSLADALRANERLPPPPPAKLINSTYRALCHDDPIVSGAIGGDASCTLLAERIVEDAFGLGSFAERAGGASGGGAISEGGVTTAVKSGIGGMTIKRRGGKGSAATGTAVTAAASAVSTTRPQSRLVVPTVGARNMQGSGGGINYALSDRLVGGILQATDRTPAPTPASSASMDASASKRDSQDSDRDGVDKEKEEEPEGFVAGPSGGQSAAPPATPAGYSELAYAALVRGPLLCCRSANNADIGKVASFLGSYGGHVRSRCGKDGKGDTTEDDKNKASKWEDEMLEKAAEAYVQSMLDMGKISGSGTASAAAVISPPLAEDEKKERDVDDDEEEWDSIGDSSSSSKSGSFNDQEEQQQPAGSNADSNSLEEIFAEESDPDDFEYESNHEPATELTAAVQHIEESFDPANLSKVNNSLSWDDARDRLASLVDELAYNRLVFLSKARWDSLGVSSTLVELTRILLDADVVTDATGAGSGSRNVAVARTETLLRRPAHMTHSPSLEGLTGQWSKPLFALRDRALDETYGHDALDGYIRFVKALLNSPAGPSGDAGKPSPSKVVGLSSLSTLCGYDGILRTNCAAARQKVRSSVVDSIDGIIDLVELIRQGSSSPTCAAKAKRDLPSAYIIDDDDKEDVRGQDETNMSSEWFQVAVSLLPILQFLTNTQFSDYGRLDWSASSSTLTTQEAQALLSTGLFRELILLQTRTSERDGAVAVARTRLLRAIFVLSSQSVNVLGKYATRVPELTLQIHSDAFATKNVVDSTLWSALTAALQSSSKSTVKLRDTAALPSVEKLNGDCLRGFVHLCGRAGEALDAMVSEDTNGEGESQNDSIENAPYDFVEFTNCIASLPSVAKSWINAVASVDGGADKAKQCLKTITGSLSRIPVKKIASTPPVPGKDHEAGDDFEGSTANEVVDAQTELNKKSGRINEALVSSTRKGLKIMSLLLEAGPIDMSELDKPASSYALSSKTD